MTSEIKTKSSALLFGVAVLGLLAAADVNAQVTVVRPSNLQGWQIDYFNCGADPLTASATLDPGPATPPLGRGSLHLLTGTNGDSFVRVCQGDYDGTLLSDITELSYSTYVHVNNDGIPSDAAQAPYLQLKLDYVGDGGIDDTLFFEPVYQEAAPGYAGDPRPDQGKQLLDVWQTWDALHGGWWSNNDMTFYLHTLSDYASAHPGVRLSDPALGALRVSAGCGAPDWSKFDGNADNLRIATTSLRIYDFEPDSGVPVDLDGVYFAGSSDTVLAHTGPGDQVQESSGGVAAAHEGTYTPFSDALKPPRQLAVDLTGRSYQYDIQLIGSWAPADKLRVSTSDPAGIVIDTTKPLASGYRFDFSGGGSFVDSTGATSFTVKVSVDLSDVVSATVTTLDGSAPNTTTVLGSYASAPLPTQHFTVRIDGGPKSRAKVLVSNFTTTGGDNWLYLRSDNPYVMSGNPIAYRFAQANLAQTVFGYQAFFTEFDTTLQTFTSGSYTSSPYSIFLINPITESGDDIDVAAGRGFGQPPTADDGDLGTLDFSAASQGATGIDFRANVPPTRFTDSMGHAVAPSTMDSNIVVVDSTPPTLTIDSVTEGGPNLLLGGQAIQGTITIAMTADDGVGSGLICPPSLTLTRSACRSVDLDVYPGQGNQFLAQYTIGPMDCCGTWDLNASAFDDAGNTSAAVAHFSVNVAQVSVTVVLAGVSAPGPVTRCIRFVLGGTGGPFAPITINKDVVFMSGMGTTLLTGADGIPCSATGLTMISAKDPKHTLRRLTTLVPQPGTTQYSASFTVAKSLKGGDANDDNVKDILDFGIFSSQFGTAPGANTPCGYVPRHADFSANGLVDSADFSFFISVGPLVDHGEGNPGNYSIPDPPGRKRVTVEEMIEAGVAMAAEFDLNGDGWITYREVYTWLLSQQE